MLLPEQVTRAIYVNGYQVNDNGTLTDNLKKRLDFAARLFRQGVAPVIIVSGWYPLKRIDLAKHCEASLMEQYLRAKYGQEQWAKDLVILQEPDSNSIPENVLFTQQRFPNLRQIAVASGELLLPRLQLFFERIFSEEVTASLLSRVNASYWETCNVLSKACRAVTSRFC